MIQEWFLERFKSIASRQTLTLRPLTVFAGANSSGKSTVLQSMLLLSQTISSKVERRQLLLNGDLVRLGTLDDVISQADGKQAITIGFTLKTDARLLQSSRTQHSYYPWYVGPTSENTTIRAELCFAKSTSTSPLSESRHAELLEGTFSAHKDTFDVETDPAKGRRTPVGKFTISSRSDSEAEDIRVSSSAKGIAPETLNACLKYAFNSEAPITVESFPYRSRDLIAGRTLDVVGVSLEHFLPQFIVLRRLTVESHIANALTELTLKGKNLLGEWSLGDDLVRKTLADQLRTSAAEAKPNVWSHFAHGLYEAPETINIVNKVLEIANQAEGGKDTHFEIVPPAELMSSIAASISTEFSSLRYLGPLRDEPRPLYDIGSGSDPRDVGTKGEFTAAVLDLYGGTLVDFVPPHSPEAKPTQCSLRVAVHAWLKHFDIATAVEAVEAGKLGHRLHILPQGLKTQVDLTNVGVGVSQVLPILVMALISEPGSVLLFEQPELHLHPRVQSQLADFFLCVMRTGRQCILETHSEYLVNRLRRRVAESDWGSSMGESVLLYFVQRNGLQSTFARIDINPYGAIPDWPQGFFDQGPTESESILVAAAEKRAKKV